MVKDASPVGLVTPAAPQGPMFEPRLGRISGWGQKKKTLAAEVRVRGVFSVGTGNLLLSSLVWPVNRVCAP
jgi:hypothetical protein